MMRFLFVCLTSFHAAHISWQKDFFVNCICIFKDIVDCRGQCQHGASCQDLENDYRCLCPAGFTGKNCQINVDDCQSNPCMNNGVCMDKVSSYQCVCQTGFYGNRCQHHTNECQPNPCIHGICTDLDNDYRCDCEVNWSGKNCSVRQAADLGNCNHNRCQHGSTCVSLPKSEFRCHCLPGYTGGYCEINIDECTNDPCKNGGVCVDRVNGYQCVCPAGFEGKSCERNRNDCLSRPCKNNGECIDGVGKYTCKCTPGYTGVNCTYDIDECINVKCQHGGTCINLLNSFKCKCKWVEFFQGGQLFVLSLSQKNLISIFNYVHELVAGISMTAHWDAIIDSKISDSIN